ncbi:MAG: acyltransferase family protein [Chitinophagaceae bacterium]
MPPPDRNSVRQDNNFDFLRLISSSFVIISHSYSLTGREAREALMKISGQTYHFSSLGLICFFVISGYLVSQSLFNSPSIINYAWKRFLRIVPALCLVIVFSIFIIGPLFTSIPLSQYFSSPLTYAYFKNIFFVFPLQWQLPGLFTNNPESSVNGSLWTLILEGRLYILLMILFLFRFFKKRLIPLIVFTIAVIATPFFNLVFKGVNPYPFHFAIFFFAGVIANLYRDKIVYNKWLAFMATVIIVLRCFYTEFNVLSFFAFPYLVLYLGQLRSLSNKAGKYGDFSYGLFLFSFPVQQCIVFYSNGNISIPTMIFLSMLLTLPFAILSWKFVESKALKYKFLVK